MTPNLKEKAVAVPTQFYHAKIQESPCGKTRNTSRNLFATNHRKWGQEMWRTWPLASSLPIPPLPVSNPSLGSLHSIRGHLFANCSGPVRFTCTGRLSSRGAYEKVWLRNGRRQKKGNKAARKETKRGRNTWPTCERIFVQCAGVKYNIGGLIDGGRIGNEDEKGDILMSGACHTRATHRNSTNCARN